jgi:hypothetical protein
MGGADLEHGALRAALRPGSASSCRRVSSGLQTSTLGVVSIGGSGSFAVRSQAHSRRMSSREGGSNPLLERAD